MMPKVILELEMPQSCWDCPLQAISEKKIKYCTVIRYSTDYYGTKRRPDCPLKPIDISIDETNCEKCGKTCQENDLYGDTDPIYLCKNCFDELW